MEKFKDLFNPTKKKLIAASFILFNSLFIIYGILLTDIATYSVDWSWWQNYLMIFFSLTNFFGVFFQAPYFLIEMLIPGQSKILDVLGIIINSYILGCLMGRIWESKIKSRKEKELIFFYFGIWMLFNIAIFFTFFTVNLFGFLVFSACVLGAAFITRVYKKLNRKIFLPLSLLTIIFSIGAFYLTIHNFEDAYCWSKTSSQDFNTHMKCHENFNLLQAISETGF